MSPRIQLDRDALVAWCRKWHVRELSLFGSALRDDFGPDSDLDFLVSFEAGSALSLWEFVTMREELSAQTGRAVDLVDREGLRNPFRRREILAHRVVLHAA